MVLQKKKKNTAKELQAECQNKNHSQRNNGSSSNSHNRQYDLWNLYDTAGHLEDPYTCYLSK